MKKFTFIWFDEIKSDNPIPERTMRTVVLIASDIWDALDRFEAAYSEHRQFNIDSITMSTK